MRVAMWLMMGCALAAQATAGTMAEENTSANTPPMFESDGPIPVTFTAPFASLAADDAAEPIWRPGTLVWTDDAGTEHPIALDVRPRGKSRRRDEVCKFPPLRLDLPKGETGGTPFAELNKVKLVTHCSRLGQADARTEQRLQLELVVYRLFNRLTPASFRVRPLTITYVDSDRGNRASVHPGFLIEPDAALARRLDAKVLDVPGLERTQLDAAQANLVEVFQYFIGNTDFSLLVGPEGDSCCHNSVPLAPKSGAVIPVPYDFDATGVVDPPYAAPLPQLKIRDVRQRLYRGHCRPDTVLAATLDKFRAAREDLYAIVSEDSVLNERSKQSTLDYFDQFFATIDSPEQVKSKLSSRCT